MNTWLSNVPVFFTVLLEICSVIAVLAGVVFTVTKLALWLKHPAASAHKNLRKHIEEAAAERDELRTSIKVNQQALERAFNLLDRDDKRLEAFERNFKILYKSLWALLDHAVTKNSNSILTTARDELQKHIIDN